FQECGTESMTITKKSLEYKDASGKTFEGLLCYPTDLESSNSKRAAVLVLHAFAGCTDFEKEQAEKLAKQGFVALAADVYGKGVKGTSKEECFGLMRPLIEGDRSDLGGRLLAARNAVAGLEFVDGSKIGAIGYCFGGLCALDMARRNVAGLKAAVSFHGTLKPIPDAPLGAMEAAVQAHNGQADPHIGKDQITGFYEEMNARKADWQFIEHGFALHAFTEPHADSMGVPGVGYQKKAAERSWKIMSGFMEERLA
ncbi:hypothetical protein PRIPAC_88245, partial [Pristionchus pacificus]